MPEMSFLKKIDALGRTVNGHDKLTHLPVNGPVRGVNERRTRESSPELFELQTSFTKDFGRKTALLT